MTRTKLLGMLVGIAFVHGGVTTDLTLAQSGETVAPTRDASGYSTKGSNKGMPAGRSNTQPSGGAASGGTRTTYGPVLPQNGPPSIRRTAGEEPVREPMSGTNPGGAVPSKSGIPQGAPGSANNPLPLAVEVTPRQPKWYPLAPNVQKWVDEVLVAWEKTSEEIVTFKCDFKRWEHDPAFGPKDPKIPFTYGKGIIQYAKPDKGMFKVESLLKYSPPKVAGGKPEWLEQIGEQWVCDGRSIFEFSIREKRLYQRILPTEMQGKAIADGPLPFLFGAKVSTIKARYWIRPAPDVPAGHEREYWLEAIPRFSRDAANFQKVSIILDEKDFLPKALDVYAPNYNSKTNPAHTEYAFEKRETTLKSDPRPPAVVTKIIESVTGQFYEPKVPSGWKKVKEDMNEMPQGPLPVQGPAPAPGTAQRPAGTKTKTK